MIGRTTRRRRRIESTPNAGPHTKKPYAAFQNSAPLYRCIKAQSRRVGQPLNFRVAAPSAVARALNDSEVTGAPVFGLRRLGILTCFSWAGSTREHAKSRMLSRFRAPGSSAIPISQPGSLPIQS